MTLSVQRLARDDPAGALHWDRFVQACPQATFFHRSGWQSILADVLRHETHFLFAQQGGQIRGVLPLAHMKSLLFGSSLVSLPFAVYGGVAASDPAAADALESAAQEIASRLGVDHLELRNVMPRHADWPRQDLYATFRKAVLPDEEANLQGIPRKQRAMVRKGIARGLRGEIDEGVDRFYGLYADNVHRHGTPGMSRRYFAALRDEFGPDCEVLTVVDASDRPVSSVLSFYFRDEVLPYYAGDTPAARELAANDFKYWDLMRRACVRGLKIFDFGRSKRGSGSFAFKRNWGFEPQPLHYEYCLYKREGVPQNNPANAKFQFLIRTWRRLPIGVANRLGPLVVRGLG